MEKFNFKEVLRENLYNSKYPGDDKVRLVLNEGKTLLIEREIHEGIMDLLKGFTKSKPGWKKELEKQIDTWLAKSKLDDGAKASLKKYYMKNLENLPAEFYKDEQNLKQVEDSLNAAEDGDANKAKEELDDAAKSAEGGSGEDLKAQGGDLVIVTFGDNELLLRIAGGGETRQSEPESRRGSLGSRARSRANRRFGSGGMKLGSGYSGSLRENILRLNEKEYKIDAGILLKTGTKYLPKKAVDLTVDNARIATDEEIEQIKKKYPEQFEKFFGSQGKSSAKLKAGDIVVYKNKKGEEIFIKVLKDLLEAEGDNKRFFAGDQLNLKTGKFFARKATDNQQLPLSNVVRVATEKDIAKAKEKYPEQIAQLIGSQGNSEKDSENTGDAAAQLVDANTDLIARYLLKPDKDAAGKIKMIFKPFFEKAGIPWKGGEAVNDLLSLMRQVATNRKIRSRMTSMTNQKNESKKITNKIIKESLRAYIKNEIKK